MRNSNDIKQEKEIRSITEQILALSILRASLLTDTAEQQQPSSSVVNEPKPIGELGTLRQATKLEVKKEPTVQPVAARQSTVIPLSQNNRGGVEEKNSTAYVPKLVYRSHQYKSTPARNHRGHCSLHTVKHSPSPQQVRANVQKQQASERAQRKLARIQASQKRRRRALNLHQSARDASGDRLYIGDCVRALTQGRSHTDIGIVNKFSKVFSRVFFINFRGVEQQRAPENVVYIEQHE